MKYYAKVDKYIEGAIEIYDVTIQNSLLIQDDIAKDLKKHWITANEYNYFLFSLNYHRSL